MPKCKYESCDYEINLPHDEEFCLFHAPSEKKGIEENEFNNKLLIHYVNNDPCSFDEFKFPFLFDIKKILPSSDSIVNKEISFKNCSFEGVFFA